MAYSIDITPNDFDDLARLFDDLGAHLTDMSDVMADLGELFMHSTKERFLAGEAPDGNPWAPKSPATIEAYRRREGRKPNAKIDFRPLHGPTGRLSTEIFYQAGPSAVEIGSPLVYAGVMQAGAAKGAFGSMSNGSPIPWGGIPARPFLGLSEDDQLGAQEIVEEWLDQIISTHT